MKCCLGLILAGVAVLGVTALTCGAAEVAYVESSLTGALSTGVMVTPSTKVVVDYAFVNENSRSQWLFGNTGNLGVAFVCGQMNRYAWVLEDNGETGPTGDCLVDTSRHTGIIDAPNRRVSVVTGPYTNMTVEVTTSCTKNGTVPLALFARGTNAAGTTFDKYATARIYSCETIEDGVTTHLFVPCAGGFKDLLTDAVKTCATTGTLTYVAGCGSVDDYQRDGDVLSCRVTVVAQAGGTVSLAGGACAASDSGWVEFGQEVSLSATPSEGCAFSHWTGETWAIASGVTTDPTITVRADRALRLQAVFRSAAPGANALHYVRKGLVVQYDGIENAGMGVHDTSVRTWTDLSGNGNDGVLGSAITWGATGWVNNQDGKPVDAGTVFGPALAKRTFTMEFTCMPTRKTTREVFVGQYNYANRGYNVEHNSGSAQKGQVRLWLGGNPDINTDELIDANETASIAVAVTPTVQRLYRDGVLGYTRNDTLANAVDLSDKLIIGGENARATMAFRGTFHSFRFYGRELSPAERQLNDALDAIRFRGASTTTVAMPSGYFFDVEGTPRFRVVAAASGRGAVALGGEAACGAITNDAPVNGACTMTVTAVPSEGYEFAGWTGDVGTIVRGRESEATITITALEPTLLAAAFTPVEATTLPASGLYVTNGLVLWFDGVENAGFGVHDTATRTWKDLSGNNRDGALASGVTWTDQGWRNAANGRPVQVTDTAVAQTVATKNYTVEFACRPSRKSSRESFASLYTGNGLSIEHNSGTQKNGMVRTFFDGKPDNTTSVILDANETASISVAVGETAQSIYKNGGLGFTGTTKITGTFPTTSPFVVGGEPLRDTQAFYGDYYACRVYNRKLTPGEVAINARADILRFLKPVVSCWTNLVGGTWGDDASWSAGVPNVATPAVVLSSAPDYTIDVKETVPAVTNLFVANGEGTACINVADHGVLEVRKGRMDIVTGGRIQVGPGGLFVHDGLGVNNDDNSKFAVVNAGGTLAVTGGSAEFRNYTGKLSVQGSEAAPGRVSITDGSLSFAPARVGGFPQIQTGGRFEMTGGSFSFANPLHNTSYASFLNGGVLDLAGSANFKVSGCNFQAKGGRIHLGGNAKLRCSTRPTEGDIVCRFLLSSGVAGGYTELTVDDYAAVELDGQQAMAYLANCTAGEHAVMNWNSTESFVAKDTLAIGFRKGLGELNITCGRVVGGGYGARIAQGAGGVFGGDCPTGVVTVAGGSLQTTSCWNSDTQFNGLIVGAGNYCDLANPGFYRGTLNVRGGAVTNANSKCYLGVGIGYAEGDVNQTAGEIVHLGTTYLLVIGAWGGTARWTTAGGLTRSKSDVYVGGILTNQLAHKAGKIYQNCPITRHNASAQLVVSNGSFVVEKKLLTGEDGTATVTLGEGGTLSAASASLKNTTLTYAFGKAGTGALNVSGALAIGSNVALVVEAGDFEGNSGVFPILSCGSQTGEFVSVTVRNAHGMMVVKTATGYEARKSSGTVLLVR